MHQGALWCAPINTANTPAYYGVPGPGGFTVVGTLVATTLVGLLGTLVGGTGVSVGGTGVSVGGTGVSVGGTGVSVGGTGVFVGGTDVSVGGTGVFVGGTGVSVGGRRVAVDSTFTVAVAVFGSSGVAVSDSVGNNVLVAVSGTAVELKDLQNASSTFVRQSMLVCKN